MVLDSSVIFLSLLHPCARLTPVFGVAGCISGVQHLTGTDFDAFRLFIAVRRLLRRRAEPGRVREWLEAAGLAQGRSGIAWELPSDRC